MKTYDSETPSYLMLAVNLEMPVSLGTFFESGITFDSHITLLDSKTFLDKEKVYVEAIKLKMLEFLEAASHNDPIPINNLFDLDAFPSGFVILRLKENSSLYRYLEDIHKKLVKKFHPTTEFKKFEAHITLAEINNPESYLENESLKAVLKDSTVKFEDLVFSYSVGENKYDTYDLTHNNSVDRFFRIENLKKEIKDL